MLYPTELRELIILGNTLLEGLVKLLDTEQP